MKWLFVLSVFFFLLCPLSPAFPQPPGVPRPPGDMRPWREEPRCFRAADLNLSLDQMKRLDTIHQVHMRETQLLRAELWLKNIEFREILTNPGTKPESLRAKYVEISEVQNKLEEKIFEGLVKVRILLTQEQLKRWCPEQEFLPLRRIIMQGPGSRGMMLPRRPPLEEPTKDE